MYVLIGEKSYTAPPRIDSRGFWVVPRPNPVIQDEPVALFTTKKKAEEYAESVTLVSPVWSLIEHSHSYKVTQRFFKKSVLARFTSWRVQKQWKGDLSTNLRPHKRVRR